MENSNDARDEIPDTNGFRFARGTKFGSSKWGEVTLPEGKENMRLFVKLSKNDTGSKLKALSEISNSIEGSDEHLSKIISLWAMLFRKLSIDSSENVRYSFASTHLQLVKRAKRTFLPYLEMIIGPWLSLQFDIKPKIASRGSESLKEAFPNKMSKILKIYKEQIISHINSGLRSLESKTKMHPERRELIVSEALHLTSYIMLNSEDISAQDLEPIFSNSNLWDFQNYRSKAMGTAWCTLMISMMEKEPEIVLKNLTSKSHVELIFDTKDCIMDHIPCKMLTTVSERIPSIWSEPKLKSALCSYISSDNTCISLRMHMNILDLIKAIPKAILIQDQNYKLEFIKCMWEGFSNSPKSYFDRGKFIGLYYEVVSLLLADFNEKNEDAYLPKLFNPINWLLDYSEDSPVKGIGNEHIYLYISKILDRFKNCKFLVDAINEKLEKKFSVCEENFENTKLSTSDLEFIKALDGIASCMKEGDLSHNFFEKFENFYFKKMKECAQENLHSNFLFIRAGSWIFKFKENTTPEILEIILEFVSRSCGLIKDSLKSELEIFIQIVSDIIAHARTKEFKIQVWNKLTGLICEFIGELPVLKFLNWIIEESSNRGFQETQAGIQLKSESGKSMEQYLTQLFRGEYQVPSSIILRLFSSLILKKSMFIDPVIPEKVLKCIIEDIDSIVVRSQSETLVTTICHEKPKAVNTKNESIHPTHSKLYCLELYFDFLTSMGDKKINNEKFLNDICNAFPRAYIKLQDSLSFSEYGGASYDIIKELASKNKETFRRMVDLSFEDLFDRICLMNLNKMQDVVNELANISKIVDAECAKNILKKVLKSREFWKNSLNEIYIRLWFMEPSFEEVMDISTLNSWNLVGEDFSMRKLTDCCRIFSRLFIVVKFLNELDKSYLSVYDWAEAEILKSFIALKAMYRNKYISCYKGLQDFIKDIVNILGNVEDIFSVISDINDPLFVYCINGMNEHNHGYGKCIRYLLCDKDLSNLADIQGEYLAKFELLTRYKIFYLLAKSNPNEDSISPIIDEAFKLIIKNSENLNGSSLDTYHSALFWNTLLDSTKTQRSDLLNSIIILCRRACEKEESNLDLISSIKVEIVKIFTKMIVSATKVDHRVAVYMLDIIENSLSSESESYCDITLLTKIITLLLEIRNKEEQESIEILYENQNRFMDMVLKRISNIDFKSMDANFHCNSWFNELDTSICGILNCQEALENVKILDLMEYMTLGQFIKCKLLSHEILNSILLKKVKYLSVDFEIDFEKHEGSKKVLEESKYLDINIDTNLIPKLNQIRDDLSSVGKNSIRYFQLICSYILKWKSIIDIIDCSTFNLRSCYLNCPSISNEAFFLAEVIVGLFKDFKVPEEAIKKEYDFYHSAQNWRDCTCGIAAHVFFLTLSIIPEMIFRWFKPCSLTGEMKDLFALITSYFSPKLVEQIMDTVNKAELNTELLEVITNLQSYTVSAIYKNGTFILELLFSIPKIYPLEKIEIKSPRSLNKNLSAAERYRHARRNLRTTQAYDAKISISISDWEDIISKAYDIIMRTNGHITDAIISFSEKTHKYCSSIQPCSVCFDIINDFSKLVPTKFCRVCSSGFHEDCLYRWFESSGKSACPMCRQPI